MDYKTFHEQNKPSVLWISALNLQSTTESSEIPGPGANSTLNVESILSDYIIILTSAYDFG